MASRKPQISTDSGSLTDNDADFDTLQSTNLQTDLPETCGTVTGGLPAQAKTVGELPLRVPINGMMIDMQESAYEFTAMCDVAFGANDHEMVGRSFCAPLCLAIKARAGSRKPSSIVLDGFFESIEVLPQDMLAAY